MFFSSAVLAVGVLADAALGASVHQHLHRRATAGLTAKGSLALSNKGIILGANAQGLGSAPITVGKGGPYLVEFTNNSPNDVNIVVWSGLGQEGSIRVMYPQKVQPNITQSVARNSKSYISFNPNLYTNHTISGAFAAVHPDTVVDNHGLVGDTWGEFTFIGSEVNDMYAFSTMDVSRQNNVQGHPMSISTYPSVPSKADTDSDADAYSAVEPACVSDMTHNVFSCADGLNTCMEFADVVFTCAQAQDVICNAAMKEGGCMGMTKGSGFARVVLT